MVRMVLGRDSAKEKQHARQRHLQDKRDCIERMFGKLKQQ